MKVHKVLYGTFLDTREKADGIFELLRPLYATIVIDNEVYECVVPIGFLTDFASVPRVPFAYMLFGGKYNKTGTLHDALYSNFHKIEIAHATSRELMPITRLLADNILYRSLIDEGASRFTAWSMYQGVKVFGGAFFKRK